MPSLYTKLLVSVNSGNSKVVRAEVLRVAGVSAEDAVVTRDVAGNVSSISLPSVEFAKLTEVMTSLLRIPGVARVDAPEMRGSHPAVRADLAYAVKQVDIVTGELLSSQSDIVALDVAKAKRVPVVGAEDAIDLATAMALVNELKTKLNSMNA